MKLNQFTDLGLRTLIYLTQPQRASPFTISEMAQQLNISKNHLVKVVHFMAKMNWVNTTRGKGGGVVLAKAPAEYRLGSVIRLLEEHVDQSHSLVNCDSPYCILNPVCKLKSLLHDALNVFFDYLEQYTLADAVRNPLLLNELQLIDVIRIE